MKAILWFFILFGPVQVLWATTFFVRPFPEEVRSAPLIVRGIVGNSHADWGTAGDGSKRIYTYTDLQVSEVFKGDIPGKSILLREMGGEIEGVGMQVAGTARFERGDDVVVFVGDRGKEGSLDYYPVHNMSMGLMNVTKDSLGSETLSGGPLSVHAQHMIHPSGDSHQEDGHEDGHNDSNEGKKWTVSDLRNLVKKRQDNLNIEIYNKKQDVNEKTQSFQSRVMPSSSGAFTLQKNNLEAGESQAGFPIKTALLLFIGVGVLIGATWRWLRKNK